ncbi:MAG: serine/threonine-protein kinase, partial [Kofleriaceae bacterium]
MQCPDENIVLDFVEGRLAAGALAETDAHLASCEDCRRVVSALARGSAPGALGEPHAFVEGMRVGRYLLLEHLGDGGMGVVHAAWDPELDRRIAIKLLRPELRDTAWAHARARLLREGRAIARLAHPNVVAVHDVGELGGGVFVAMEYVDGGALATWRDQTRGADEVIAAFAQAARGLAAAHAAGLIHRDVKPANLLIGRDGRVRVVDFGLANAPAVRGALPAAAGDTTTTGALLGTPLYMAPEIHAGAIADERSDQYGLALSLYEVLAGVKPFTGSTLDQLAQDKRARALATPARRVPPRVLAILERALAPDPTARWPSMQVLADQLGRYLGRRRRRAIYAAAIAVAALAAGVTLLGGHRAHALC